MYSLNGNGEYSNNCIPELIPLNNPILRYEDTDLFVINALKHTPETTNYFINDAFKRLEDFTNHHAYPKHWLDVAYICSNVNTIFTGNTQFHLNKQYSGTNGCCRIEFSSQFKDGYIFIPEDDWHFNLAWTLNDTGIIDYFIDHRALVSKYFNDSDKVKFRKVPCIYSVSSILPNILEYFPVYSPEQIFDAKLLTDYFGYIAYPNILTTFVKRRLLVDGKSQVLMLSKNELESVWHECF